MDFEEAIREIGKGAQIDANPSFGRLLEISKKEGVQTAYGSMCYTTKIRGRSASLTTIIEGKPTSAQESLITSVAQYLKGKKLLRVDRRMCMENPFYCRAYVSAAYPHIPFMWAKMLFPPKKGKSPDFTSVQVPEWQETKILAHAPSGITFILGSDYTGELKKANLRMAMHKAKMAGGLGLHAGSKTISALQKDGKLIEKGVLLFGLSATGKTTLTCHHHWLDASKGESVTILQDDVVLMQADSSCRGTEDNFYIKTEGLEPKSQPLLYKAATSPNALLENVKLNGGGKPDFSDCTLTSNGRAVVLRSEIGHTKKGISLKEVDMILFITRWNNIVPAVAKLGPLQAAAFFMLGESVGSAASDIDAGKPRRVVGTNPFIIGPEYEEGNRFLEILGKNPHLECYLLNTGGVGEGGKGEARKITVHDSASIIKEIARGGISWEQDGEWGYLLPKEIPEVEGCKLHPRSLYEEEEYARLTNELRISRKEWLSKFKGLNPKISGAI
ncbi:phosphoenolpyruvate carboxykinase [Candidatus Micrarchaeota archaeon]|nr:phosphoenolpyruvate carboxykinase [Candidatus Micrarchaeota archaeon]